MQLRHFLMDTVLHDPTNLNYTFFKDPGALLFLESLASFNSLFISGMLTIL